LLDASSLVHAVLTCIHLPQEQLHFRKWLRQHNVADSPLLESEANDAECEVCGTVPFFAVVRCACNASRIACPQHGAALCARAFCVGANACTPEQALHCVNALLHTRRLSCACLTRTCTRLLPSAAMPLALLQHRRPTSNRSDHETSRWLPSVAVARLATPSPGLNRRDVASAAATQAEAA